MKSGDGMAPPVGPNPEPGSYDARLTGHPWKSFSQPLSLSGAGAGLPTTYIRCVSDDPVSAFVEGSAARANADSISSSGVKPQASAAAKFR